jgi:hypothetical protein
MAVSSYRYQSRRSDEPLRTKLLGFWMQLFAPSS